MTTTRGHLLAMRVAEAASAWLTEPTDPGVYQRLVTATLAWRAHTQPTLNLPKDDTADVPKVGEWIDKNNPQATLKKLLNPSQSEAPKDPQD